MCRCLASKLRFFNYDISLFKLQVLQYQLDDYTQIIAGY